LTEGSEKNIPLQILVIGMHRSGTSALTGALNRAGVYLGDKAELTPTSWENPKGFFERSDARRICDSLLRGSDSDWWKVSGFSADNIDHEMVRTKRSEIRNLIGHLNGEAESSWALKEPRLCLLLPVFRGFLSNQCAVIVARHPTEVARSLRRRNGFPIAAGMALWEAYMCCALQNAGDLEHFIVRYDEILDQPEQLFGNLFEWLEQMGMGGLDVDAAVRSISPELRREHAREDDDKLMTGAQKELWARLHSRALTEPPPSLSPGAQRILGEFEIDQATVERFRAVNQEQKDNLKHAHGQVVNLKSDVQQYREKIGRLEKRLAKAAEAEAALAQAKEHIETLTKQVENERNRVIDLENLRERLADAEPELYRSKHRIETLRSELSKQVDRINELERGRESAIKAKAELVQANDHIETLKAELEQAHARRETLEPLREQIAEREQSLALLRENAASRQAELIDIKSYIDTLKAELASGQLRANELEALREQLSAKTAELEAVKRHAEAVSSQFEDATNRLAGLTALNATLSDYKRDLASEKTKVKTLQSKLTLEQKNREQIEAEAGRQASRAGDSMVKLEKAETRIRELLQRLELLQQEKIDRPGHQQSGQSNTISFQQVPWKNNQQRMELFETAFDQIARSRTLMILKRLRFMSLNPLRWSRDRALRIRGRRVVAAGLFDTDWYLKEYPDVRWGAKSPLEHYLTVGFREGRWPHPAFDPAWYALQLDGETFESRTPVEHYLDAEPLDRVSPHRLFDQEWYLENNPDVADDGGPPLSHFLLFGGFEGRNPNPDFECAVYLQQNPDLADKRINPLIHYLTVARESAEELGHGPELMPFKMPEPWARDVQGSGENLGDSKTAASNDDGLRKNPKTSSPVFLAKASAAGSNAHALELVAESSLFDAEWYKRRYRDISRKGADPLRHYLKNGAKEGRDPSPMFSTTWYVDTYLDSISDNTNPLVHYLEIGSAKGYRRLPPPRCKFWWDHVRNTPGQTEPEAPETTSRNVFDALNRIAHKSASVVIVIPVFNAPDELRVCLESVLRHSRSCDRIIAIDDASTDTRVADVLKEAKRKNGIEVFCNDENLGFTGTVNRGFELSGRSDVILLNADTAVTTGWVERLRLAVYSEPRIGTATPMSNNAGAFSVPVFGQSNDVPEIGLDAFARAIAQTSLYRYPRTPTGNGFCMYIRRDCLDETGYFDVDAFPVGYGEENDFCMRAGSRSWSHIVDDATYIFHVRSASFGEAKKEELLKAGRAVIDSRYPEYGAAVRTFVNSELMAEVRSHVARIADASCGNHSQVKPRVLYVLPALSAQGGTPQTNQDLMQAIGDRVETFVLRSNSASLELFSFRDGEYVPLEYARLESPLSAFPHRSEQYDSIFSEWLTKYQIELVHVRHIAFHSLGLIDVAKALSVRVVFSFHDFYAICPTVKLLDENRFFCGGECTKTPGDCQHDLWADPEFPKLKNAAVFDWRKMLESAIGQCDSLVTTAESAKSLILRNFPALADMPFTVIPHGRNFAFFSDDTVPSIQVNETIRVLVPGSIGYAKGAGVLAELAAAASDQDIEIHVLGRLTEGGPIPGVIEHGAYTRDDFVARVREIRPHIGAVLSIWPETFCHTLTEQWAAGVPVVGFDFGAVAERIRDSGAGWVLEQTTADAVLELFADLRKNPQLHDRAVQNVVRWQKKVGLAQTNSWMANRYQEIYESVHPAISLCRESNVACGNLSSKRAPIFRQPADWRQMAGEIGSVSIIVPVHNAFDDCRRCLQSLINHTFPAVELVVVDDGSNDDTRAWLESFAEQNPHVVLRRHSTALGYTHAVNAGAEASDGEILVILNSDTIVPPFWLERLVEPLLQDSNAVAAGPVSNAATWQSIPAIRSEDGSWATNRLPSGMDGCDFDRWVQTKATDLAPEAVQLLNGFCYAIRANAFHEMGGLDADAFPSGYGEETDLFLKLADRQYRAVVVPNLYIYHAKSKSFGKERRQELSAKGNEVLYERYGKERIVAAAATLKDSKTLGTLRKRCKESDPKGLKTLNETFRILFLMPVAGVGGGVHSIVQEAEGLSGRGHDVAVLIRKEHEPLFKQSYPSQYAEGLFETFASNASLVEKTRVRDVIIATHFLSIRLLKKARNQLPDKLFMYYVQDYEPWIVPKRSPLYQEALESYAGLEGAVLMAKTRWICRMVHSNHYVPVHKIAPSIDHSIYRVDGTSQPRITVPSITIAAMVRPTTPRRAPAVTISVLKAIRNHMGPNVNIEVFGCTDDELFGIAGVNECKLENRGVLLREGVSSVLNRADLFIDMSSYQAFGRTALEAMASGTVAAVPVLGGGSEYNWAGQAVLPLPTDDTNASTDLILALLKDQERMDAMRKRGLAIASQFSLDKAAASIEDLILRCCRAAAETEPPSWKNPMLNDSYRTLVHGDVHNQERRSRTAQKKE